MAFSQTVPTSEEQWRRYLVGWSPAMEKLVEKVRLIGPKRATVLLVGETGTGKEMTARAIHGASTRVQFPMITVNCTALPEALLEAELFGHVRGAFTGAVQSRIGRFEQANNGTIFLDEIGDMPLDTQAKLLRVLQEREFQRIGSSETLHVDVRVIAATNANLQDKIRSGRFREDLYYRLNVVPITIPPLRDRAEDIPVLTKHFIEKVCRHEHLSMRDISSEALAMLVHYPWPGNVRQLENAVEHAIAMSGDRPFLLPQDFTLPMLFPSDEQNNMDHFLEFPETGLDFEQTIGRIELRILEEALRRTGGNKTQAADMLRLKRTTLTAKLRVLSRLGPMSAPSPAMAMR